MTEKLNLMKGLSTIETVDSNILPLEFYQIDPELASEAAKKISHLYDFIVLAENASDLHDEIYRARLFGKLSYGLRKAGEAYGWILYHEKISYAQRKQAEAVAALDHFGTYLNKRKQGGDDLKATEKVKESYTQIDTGVMSATRKEAMVLAIAKQIETVRLEFIQSISTLRAICYGLRESEMLSNTATSYQLPEGKR